MADTLSGGSGSNIDLIGAVPTTSAEVFQALVQLQTAIINGAPASAAALPGAGSLDLSAATDDATLLVTGTVSGTETIELPQGFDGALVLAAGGNGTLDVTGGSDFTVIAGDQSVNVNVDKWATGSVTMVVGNGNNYLDPAGGQGFYEAGSGNDTVFQEAGYATIDAGGGNNQVQLGDVDAQITVDGNDTIFAGSGSDTIQVGLGSATVQGQNATLDFIGGSNASTVMGGAGGNDTLFGGAGGGLMFGGSGGNNLMGGDTGAVSMEGGGNNDLLFAAVTPGNNGTNLLLAAATGNETLAAGYATGNNIYGASQFGNTQIIAGGGDDTIWAGGGNDVIWAGGGDNLVVLAAGHTDGAEITLLDFCTARDKIQLFGYGANGANDILATAQVSGDATTVSLQDGTKVQFNYVTNLTTASFING